MSQKMGTCPACGDEGPHSVLQSDFLKDWKLECCMCKATFPYYADREQYVFACREMGIEPDTEE